MLKDLKYLIQGLISFSIIKNNNSQIKIQDKIINN